MALKRLRVQLGAACTWLRTEQPFAGVIELLDPNVVAGPTKLFPVASKHAQYQGNAYVPSRRLSSLQSCRSHAKLDRLCEASGAVLNNS